MIIMGMQVFCFRCWRGCRIGNASRVNGKRWGWRLGNRSYMPLTYVFQAKGTMVSFGIHNKLCNWFWQLFTLYK